MWTQARIAKARGEAGRYARCFDCVGLIKGFLWLQPNGTLKISASQDKTANEMRDISNPQPISTLPETPGVLVFCSGHVGVYIGNDRVIEAYGFKNVADRPLSAQKWTTWGKCPFIQYPSAPAPQKPTQRPTGADTVVFKENDRVRVRQAGIPYFTGAAKIPAWVAGQVYTVSSEKPYAHGGKLCVRLKEINTWCDIGNLEKVRD